MRTTHIKKTVAMSGAMFIALMGATGSADALGPHQGQSHHAKAHDKSQPNKKGKHAQAGTSQNHAASSHTASSHAASSPGKSAGAKAHSQHASTHPSTSSHQAATSHTASSDGNAGTHGGAKGGDPAGNNGTVKIAPDGDIDGIPNNTPHVGCDFYIEWYGFDEGADIISTVTFAMQAPTSDVGLSGTDPSTVFVGGDPATGAGTDTGFDGHQNYHLIFDGAPHPKQGYHVKLTINTPHSKGADVKHKVFWVQGCESETAGTTGTDTTETVPEVLGEQAHVSHHGGSEVKGEQAEVKGEQAEVKGEQAAANKAARAAVPTAVNSGLVPVTTAVNAATDEWPLAVGVLGLCLLGGGLLTRRARS